MSKFILLFSFAHVAPKLPLNRRHNPRAILGIIILDGSWTGKQHFLNRGEGTKWSPLLFPSQFSTFPGDFEYSFRINSQSLEDA